MSFLHTLPENDLIAPGVELISIPDSRFKCARIQVVFELPLDEHRAARTLLLDVLQQGSDKYPSRNKLAQRLEHLYGARINVYSERACEAHRLSFAVRTTSDSYLFNEESVLKEGLELLGELLWSPLRGQANAFKKDIVERERKNLLDMLVERKDDRSAYASERFFRHLCEGEEYGKLSWGSSEDVRAVDLEDLEAARLELINNAQVMIICSGDFHADVVKKWASEAFSLDRVPCKLPEISSPGAKEFRMVEENLPMEQSKFHFGFRTHLPVTLLDREAHSLACAVLGGGVQGRLFRDIREERSLAYGIYSQLHGRKNILSIEAGIDESCASQVQEAVCRHVDDLISSGPSEEELKFAKARRFNSLASITDSDASMASYYYSRHLLNIQSTPADSASACEKISQEDVQEAASFWKKDLAYLMSPGS